MPNRSRRRFLDGLRQSGGWVDPLTGQDGARLILGTGAVQIDFDDMGAEGSGAGAAPL